MKKGSLAAIFSILFLGSVAVSASADGNTVEMTSRVIENFDGSPYVVDGEEYRYAWQAVGSKYATKTNDQSFPQVAVVNAAPLTLERLAGETGAKSLGVQGAFSRSGFNWIDIYPTISGGEGGQPAEIPLLGRSRAIDVWVWGSNLNYYLEAYIRDNKGMVHVIPLGSLRYLGWKNLRSNIPESIPMIASQIPRSTHAVTFVKFRLWTEPNEKTFLNVEHDAAGKVTKIIPFYLYIAQLKVLTDVYETVYDGDTLANPKTVNELWSSGGGAAAPSNQAGNNQ
jgi:hypothetical protein